MNYLRGALTAGYQYYRDLPPINPSTLTGAIDVIVIQRKDENGEVDLACTPFHVRFGKWQILRPSDKKVNVLVNGRPIPFNMKIGEAGEAFFVFETEEDVPEALMTSPILQATSPSSSGGLPQKTGRFGAKEDQSSGTETDTKTLVSEAEEQNDKLSKESPIPEPEFFDLDAVNGGTPPNGLDVPPITTLPPSDADAFQPMDGPALVQPTDLQKKAAHGTGTIQYGKELGEAALRAAKEEETDKMDRLKDQFNATENMISNQTRKFSSGRLHVAPDRGDEALPVHKPAGSPPPVATLHDVVLDMAGYHSKEASDQTVRGKGGRFNFGDDLSATKASKAQAQLIASKRTGSDTEETTPTSSRAQSPEPSSTGTIIRATSEPPELNTDLGSTPPQYSWDWGGFPTATPTRSSFSHKREEHERATSLPPLGEHVQEEESDGSQQAEEEDADIHFGRGGRLTPIGEQGYKLEFKGRTTVFDLSLCGDLRERSEEEAKLLFQERRVPFQKFIEDPSIVHKDELTIKWHGRFISRAQSSPILAALVVWRQATLGSQLVQSDEEPLSSSDEREERSEPVKEAASTTTTTRWSRWFSRGKPARVVSSESTTPKESGLSLRPGLQPTSSAPNAVETVARTPSPEVKSPPTPEQPVSGPASNSSKHYVKTLRLTSDQLKELHLKKGPNSITFSLTATGTATCTARIFVWDASDQIVISDIDGTITKSDALGHVFTMIGRDWTHMGVAKLYTDICRNGYKIMYLTSRAIGQADSTRDYLKGINQNNYQLPEGPVIMSPDRLMASLHREVIMRQPEVFKMACLRDIQRLFGPTHRNPFYAGFGNRITDALSYRSVNVPSSRIFTIDSAGEVKMELLELAGYKSSYIHMTDLVDQMFPPIHRKWAPEFTDVNYWRDPMPEFDFPELTAPAPPSPTLSARSDVSTQSRLSRLRNFSLLSSSRPQEFVPPSVKPYPSYNQHQRALSGQVRGSNGNGSAALAIPGHSRHTSAGSTFAFPKGNSGSPVSYGNGNVNRLSAGMPGSYEGFKLNDEEEIDEEEEDDDEEDEDDDEEGEEDDDEGEYEEEEEDHIQELELQHEDFDDPLLATGAMDDVPFL